MKTLYDLCDGKISNAIQAVYDGMREQNERDDFKIDLRAFIESREGICVGCAATCAIQKLTQRNITIKDLNPLSSFYLGFTNMDLSEVYSLNRFDLDIFEEAIDGFREGFSALLLDYFQITSLEKQTDLMSVIRRYQINICNSNWKTEIEKLPLLVKELQDLGY